jgi:1,4-alpha-glucan branching enzyme/maltooligosyltrehalose trehalohydrolase
MPFGARILSDGSVNFRLLAPGADKVELCLQGRVSEFRLSMAAEDDGWHGITTDLAGNGFHYRYLINGQHYVPDPASRYQPLDVNGPSQVIDPETFQWHDNEWSGLPWGSAVFYELHVGTFTEEGTFAGVKKRLDYLLELGITAIQLMTIAEFPGRRNWGYDGVLPFAPESSYGSPDELKDLIDTAHAKRLMVFNDVVYSHFGPEGNYLHLYAPAFFTDRFHTPWGDAVNFDAKHNHWVRRFFIHNALYWLEEYHFDGLRLDAVHAIFDDSSPDILEELAEAVRLGPGYDRRVYLVLENDNNAAHYLSRNPSRPHRYFDAQWNDDIHHVLHVLVTGETTGYYRDYTQHPLHHLRRCLTEGFAYQGEVSAYRDGKCRGESCLKLPLASFISFLQNHDQVGNRALGERISSLCAPEALRAATAILLLTPSPPMLFMGQEWACGQPFTYFVDFPEELGDKVTEGRLLEFARFPEFSDSESRRKIPLPNAAETYQLARLAWDELDREPHRQWLNYHRELLRIRSRHIIPRLNGTTSEQADYRLLNDSALTVQWRLKDGSTLMLVANLGCKPARVDCSGDGKVLFASTAGPEKTIQQGCLSPWSVIFYLQEPEK